MREPLISVVIPTYNRAGLIGKTLRSVLQQGFHEFEIIVVDDGSTDNTKAVVEGINDDRIRYFLKQNEERGAARNYGVSRSTGQYVTFLDSDDIFYPQHLLVAHEHISRNEAFFWLPYEIVNHKGELIQKHERINMAPFEYLTTKGNFMSCHGVFLKRDLLISNPFSEIREMSGSEDLDLWIRLCARHALVMDDKVTNALVDHSERSVLNFDDSKVLILRKELMLQNLEKDEIVYQELKGDYSRLKSSSYSYVALHTAMNRSNEIKISIHYLFKSIIARPWSLFDKRTAVIIKKVIQRLFT